MNNQRGSIALFLAMFMVLAIVLFGLVIDFSLSYIGKKQVHTITEAAALAGAVSGELVLVMDVDGEDIEYTYSARINPDKAEAAASDIISRYMSDGLLRSIEITQIEHEILDDEGNLTEDEGRFYVVTLQGIQRSLFGVDQPFAISRQSEAKLEFIGE